MSTFEASDLTSTYTIGAEEGIDFMDSVTLSVASGHKITGAVVVIADTASPGAAYDVYQAGDKLEYVAPSTSTTASPSFTWDFNKDTGVLKITPVDSTMTSSQMRTALRNVLFSTTRLGTNKKRQIDVKVSGQDSDEDAWSSELELRFKITVRGVESAVAPTPTSTAVTPTATAAASSSGLSTGAIVGISVGAVAFVVLVAVLMSMYRKRMPRS